MATPGEDDGEGVGEDKGVGEGDDDGPRPRHQGLHARRRIPRRLAITSAIVAVAVVAAVVVILATLTSVFASDGSPATTTEKAGAGAGSTEAKSAPSARGSARLAAEGGVPVDSAKFSTGACVAFAPTTGNVHHTVFIDAGHGGVDPGGQGVTETGKVIYEAAQNLAIELEVMGSLRTRGFRVVVSRTTSTIVMRPTAADMTSGVLSVQGARDDVAARDACANMAKATVLVGIYMDDGTSPQDAGSITAYDALRPFAPKSEKLARLLQRDVLAHMNSHGWKIPNDGVHTDTTLGGLPLTTVAASYRHLLLLGPADPGWFTTPSQMPGALIEPLFISDPFEGSLANSAPGHAAIAAGMVQAVEQYFEPGSG